jgi:uncharacterized protein DUF6916
MSEPDLAPDPETAAGQIDPAAFRTHAGTTFQVEAGADRIPLRLDQVEEGRSNARIMRFSLLFHGPPDRLLPQGTYVFHHDALGVMMLFIVPIVGSNAERIVYEACFSRPMPPAPAP